MWRLRDTRAADAGREDLGEEQNGDAALCPHVRLPPSAANLQA
jgi:hypothetical protein